MVKAGGPHEKAQCHQSLHNEWWGWGALHMPNGVTGRRKEEKAGMVGVILKGRGR